MKHIAHAPQLLQLKLEYYSHKSISSVPATKIKGRSTSYQIHWQTNKLVGYFCVLHQFRDPDFTTALLADMLLFVLVFNKLIPSQWSVNRNYRGQYLLQGELALNL